MDNVFSVIVTEENGVFVAVNPDTDVVSQGSTVEEALANIHEALTLYFEEVDTPKLKTRKSHPTFLTTVTI
jgi:predicted RNase H-like HicB family nuclease